MLLTTLSLCGQWCCCQPYVCVDSNATVNPVCLDSAVAVNPMFVWTVMLLTIPIFVWIVTLLTTLCVCGQWWCQPYLCVDGDVAVNPMLCGQWCCWQPYVCMDSDVAVNPMFVWTVILLTILCLCGQWYCCQSCFCRQWCCCLFGHWYCTVPVFVAALFVWTLVLYSTSVCDSPVCKDTGIVQYQYGHRDVIVHPMFVWTGTLLLTLCLCGQGYCC